MLPAQHIIGTTGKANQQVDIVVIEHGSTTFSVLMSDTSFPHGTVFPNAEDAVIAGIKAMNKVLSPHKLIKLWSAPVEEFVKNSRLAQLI